MKPLILSICILLISTSAWADDYQLSKHFHKSEFNQRQVILPLDSFKVSMALVAKLEALREVLDEPIIITSGYRSPDYNEMVGGVKYSQHLKGRAADIKVKGLKPSFVAQKAREIGFDFIKVYPTWVHVDVRYQTLAMKGGAE